MLENHISFSGLAGASFQEYYTVVFQAWPGRVSGIGHSFPGLVGESFRNITQ
jgi:hypothetical protein